MERFLSSWATIVLALLSLFWCFSLAEFNPFSDSIPFHINWPGAIHDQDALASHATVSMTTKNNEKYQCVLPSNYNDDIPTVDDESNYHGPSEEDLLKPLFQQKSCSYRIETYWTYELCHGKHIRQYHERKEVNKPVLITEYFLGKVPTEPVAEPPTEEPVISSEEQAVDQSTTNEETSRKITKKRIDGVELAYYAFNMTDGTPCDLTKQPRRSSLHYICQPEGNGEIYELKETSTCEYEVTVLSSHLCKHPSYKPKDTPVTNIDCHPIEGAPTRPQSLVDIELEKQRLATQNQQSQSVKFRVVPKPGHTEAEAKAAKPIATVLSSHTDSQLLRELLNGDYCLHGGVGWWRYEFCFGKYAQQYHEDKNQRTNILLGKWDKAKHMEFIKNHPNMKHKPGSGQKTLHLYYTDGDMCELTGKRRNVEVRLRCNEDKEHPHAVSLFLLEPSVCQYVLGVESPILCKVIDRADENGIVQKEDIP